MIFLNNKVVLVNADDEAVGEMDKLLAHRYPLQRHRAVSVWLWRQRQLESGKKIKEVLFQQRSRQKIVGALWWGNTICGNVFPGETYLECAIRRLDEELGIKTTAIEPIYKFEYQSYANDRYGEHEVDQVFVGEYDGVVTPNPDEAKDVMWIEIDELKTVTQAWRAQNLTYPTASESLAIKEDRLRQMSLAVNLHLVNREMLIVPWTMMMLLDPRLWAALK